jgi:hypothetical protein
MESEAKALRMGELRIADVKAAYGPSLATMDAFNALVLDADGGAPVATHVELGELRAGRGNHLALVCPACGAGKLLLLAKRGVLKCRTCHGHRTRRQLECHKADWNRRGAREEDALLRLLQRGRTLTSARLDQAHEVARYLISADRARVDALRRGLSILAAEVRR